MKTQLVPLSRITISGETLIRVQLSNEVITEYAAAMREGAEFPPVDLFPGSEGFYRIGDGFHRVKASGLAKRTEILAVVHEGDRNSALEFGIHANLKHGSRITNADKRKMVIMALDAWPDRSALALAELCGVSQPFVSKLRSERAITVIPPVLASQPQGVTLPPSSKYADQAPPTPTLPAPPQSAPQPPKPRRVHRAKSAATAGAPKRKPKPKNPTVDPETQEKLNVLQTLIASLSIPHRKILLKWLRIAVK
jgi:hypothetical protein